ncbi:MAG: T9SS type A sorting domain-containing protein [Bacteroidota bacterium]
MNHSLYCFKLIAFFILFFSNCSSFAQTNVGGVISSNTQWTIANSPYIVTDTVVILPNVTLTIEPGVEIKFDANQLLDVRGKLTALGTVTDSISFVSNVSELPGSWFGMIVNLELHAIIDLQYTKIKQARYAFYVIFGSVSLDPITIRNSLIEKNISGLIGYSHTDKIIFDSCHFINNTFGIGLVPMTPTGGFKLTNSYFIDNQYGLANAGGTVSNCVFACNNTGLKFTSGLIENCTISDNNTGIDYFDIFNGITVKRSAIVKNNIGMILPHQSDITNNYICNNSTANVKLSSFYNHDLRNNCWCDVDSLLITEKIIDVYDNALLGAVLFSLPVDCDSTDLQDQSDCYAIDLGMEGVPDQTSGIFEATLGSNKLIVFPNPTTDFTTIRFENSSLQNREVFIYNSAGELLRQYNAIQSDALVIEKSDLLPGLYFIYLREDGVLLAKEKLIIQ